MTDNEFFYDELGMTKQVCDLERGEEIIRDRETGECINFSRRCSECEHYHEDWNLMSYINGLEWILKGDKFSFGDGWPKGSKPECEEENAGYIIRRVLEYLYDEYEKHKNLGLYSDPLIDDGK